MNSRLAMLLLCLAAAAGAFAAGWWQGSSATRDASAISSPGTPPGTLPEQNASRAEWGGRWHSEAPAQRDVMLQAWMERDPRAALLFLLNLPPGSMAGQAQMEQQALLAWSRRDPQAAYVFAARHRRFEADYLVDEAFKTDPEAALCMLESRVHRNGCSGAGNEWIHADPANACRRLAVLPSGLKQGVLLQAAFEAWGKKDARAALEFALTLPEDRAEEALSGLVDEMPPEQAAAIVLQLKNAAHQRAAIWQLMIDWGRAEPAAAVAWAAENLPPDALGHAMHCFDTNVIDTDAAFAKQTRTEVMAALTPGAWLALGATMEATEAQYYAAGAPDWFLPKVLEKLEADTVSLSKWAENDQTPDWFAALPAERAAQVIEGFAMRETAQGKLPALSAMPESWRAAAARGMVQHMAANGVPADVRPLPAAERALVREQLTAANPAAPHGEALRRWLE